MANSTCLGVIVGNRDFFPDVLISEARKDLTKLFRTPDRTGLAFAGRIEAGAVETWADAQKCGELLRKNRDRIEGILVCLPNFGDERALPTRFVWPTRTFRFWCRLARTISISSV